MQTQEMECSWEPEGPASGTALEAQVLRALLGRLHYSSHLLLCSLMTVPSLPLAAAFLCPWPNKVGRTCHLHGFLVPISPII